MGAGVLFYDLVVVVHIIGAILGIGGATIADYLHLRGLKSHKLEKKLVSIYPIISSVVIVGLLILILTGSILLTINPSIIKNPIFRLKMVIAAIIIINGYILSKFLLPKLNSNVLHNHPKSTTRSLMFITSLCGSISIVSWYFVFIMAMTKSHGYSAISALAFYIFLIILVFFSSLMVEKRSHIFRK